MTRKRVDANQPDIVETLRGVGATVQHLHIVGQGCPDILVGFRGRNYLFEIKTARKGLNMAEQVWHDQWAGQVKVIWTADEALYEIGAMM